MTEAERRTLKEELNRLEDLQIEKFLDKKNLNIMKTHNRIKKIRKILGENK